jgi:hypothetical protein
MSRYADRDAHNRQQQAARDKLLAAELDHHAQPVVVGQFKRSAARFIPRVPVAVVERLEQAGAMTAMGLILAIHRQLVMRRCESTPLNAAVWKAAGMPTKKRREVILRNLAKVADVIVLQEARSRQGRYRVARGELWTGEL